jgi:hypothetical protein
MPCCCGPGCPDSSKTQITVAFSGIVSCGCLGSGITSVKGTDLGGVNGTYVLPRISSSEFELTGVSPAFKEEVWFSSNTCSGSPDASGSENDVIYAQCSGGGWLVLFRNTLDYIVFHVDAPTISPVSNGIICGGFVGGALFHNGIATISF